MDSPLDVVVTGSRGFIGRAVVSQLSRAGWRVLAAGRRADPGPLPPSVSYHRYREEDPASLLPADRTGQPFALVHLSWDTSRSPHFGAHARYVWQFAELLDYWATRGLSYVVGMGSAEEFGARAGTLAADDPPLGPLSPYGWGKRAAQQLLAHWSGRTGTASLWLRPFVVYGPGQTGEMLIPYAVRRALERQRAQFSDGLQERDFLYVDDLAGAVCLALERRPGGHHALNLGTGRPVAVREVLARLAEQLNAESLFQLGAIPRRPQEPHLQVADTSAAQTVLGWSATTSWTEGIDRLAATSRGQRAE